MEKEQRRITDQLEEERAQHKQLSCALAKECKWASARALEEGHRLTELSRKHDKVLTFQILSVLCCTDCYKARPDYVLTLVTNHLGKRDMSGPEEGAGG